MVQLNFRAFFHLCNTLGELNFAGFGLIARKSAKFNLSKNLLCVVKKSFAN